MEAILQTHTLDTKVTLREAYLIMFNYLDEYWMRGRNRSDDIAVLLGSMSLVDSPEGKIPADSAIYIDWLSSAKTVLDGGIDYHNADLVLAKK